jgi:hypothetical protein
VSSWRLGSQGVGQDAAEAARWYGKAAEAGSVDALFNLGVCYETGNGVPVSLVEAVKLYSRAAAKVRPPCNRPSAFSPARSARWLRWLCRATRKP